jgi:hypothetical protein
MKLCTRKMEAAQRFKFTELSHLKSQSNSNIHSSTVSENNAQTTLFARRTTEVR